MKTVIASQCLAAIFGSLLFSATSADAAHYTITNLADYGAGDPPVIGSLRQTVAAASAIPNEFHTFEFAPNLAGTLQLQERIFINVSGEILGPGSSLVNIRPADNHSGIVIDFGGDALNSGFSKSRGSDSRGRCPMLRGIS